MSEKLVDKCLECGGELQATVPCYLSAVVIGKYGMVDQYIPAFNDSYSASLALEPLEVGVDHISIYCENDHYYRCNDEGEWELDEEAL